MLLPVPHRAALCTDLWSSPFFLFLLIYALYAISFVDEELKTNRIYEHLSDGTWWEDTEHEINGEKGGTRRVFPITVYLDETYLTIAGSRTAKPVFAYAGNAACITPHT